jgi:hypothetical protein
MGYHDLSESTLTDDERLAEAGRIVSRLESSIDQLTPTERKFVLSMNDAVYVSVKQLFWLRDLLSKY